MAKTILVLTANPEGTKPIHADRELRAIRGALERSRLRDHVDLQVRGAVDRQTIRRAILDLRPTVVHFSSHGVEDGGLVIEGQDGIPEILGGEDLGAFFGLFSHHLKCVVLCACNSAAQARHISAQIDIVIGMSGRVADAAVREYSTAFYDALLAGRGFVEAHGIASLAIGCSDPADPTCPQLSARPGGDREGLGCSDDLFGDGDPAANDAPAQPSFGASVRDVNASVIAEQIRVGGDFHFQVQAPARGPDAQALRRKAQRSLETKAYGEARRDLLRLVEGGAADPDDSFHLAVAMVAGRKLRGLSPRDLEAAESYLGRALGAERAQPYLAFSALLKYEHYTLNGLRCPPPDALALLEEASRATPQPEVLRTLLGHLRLTAPSGVTAKVEELAAGPRGPMNDKGDHHG